MEEVPPVLWLNFFLESSLFFFVSRNFSERSLESLLIFLAIWLTPPENPVSNRSWDFRMHSTHSLLVVRDRDS